VSEAFRAVSMAYQHTGTAAYKTLGDTWFSAMFSKPGTGGPNPDGIYLDQLDPYGDDVSGSPAEPKWFGFHFGWSALATWPIIRSLNTSPPLKQGVMIQGITIQ
jgi:hypothetical protein